MCRRPCSARLPGSLPCVAGVVGVCNHPKSTTMTYAAAGLPGSTATGEPGCVADELYRGQARAVVTRTAPSWPSCDLGSLPLHYARNRQGSLPVVAGRRYPISAFRRHVARLWLALLGQVDCATAPD